MRVIHVFRQLGSKPGAGAGTVGGWLFPGDSGWVGEFGVVPEGAGVSTVSVLGGITHLVQIVFVLVTTTVDTVGITWIDVWPP